ncbi:TonB-dependent receptor [Neisseria sp. oral taxon 020 str. F0370]|uniref:TonB-dependent receptor domain-containing protein n=1 Tax=Neisseria sp. oral taxon 020 TaxID=712401 RepID=UPI0002A4533B|nr:TonB-dependent receptor [Neisseria sp. oral taxon 020]EKY04772.1 TonB-dependent receptor [Neisseria sp. oral taxon 020 str. F0370]
MNKTRLKTLAACIAVLGTPAAFADNTAADAAESSALETVIVKGNRNKHQTGRDRVYTREVVNLYKGKEEVETFKGNTVSDLFSGMVGVYSGDARNSGAIDPNIRGVQGQGRIPVTVDGTEQAITVWRGYAGANNRNYVDPNIISSVYVEKGPSFNRGIKSGIGGSVAMKTIDADDIVPEGQKYGLEVKIETSNNSIRQRKNVYEDSVDYRTLPEPSVATGGIWRALLDDTDRIDQRFSGRGKFLKDKAFRIAAATKQDNFDAMIAYSYRSKGNYFSGKKGAERYGYIGPLTPEKIAELKRLEEEAEKRGEKFWGSENMLGAPDIAKVGLFFHPGGEVSNTSLETKSWIGKTTFRLPNRQTLKFGLRHTDTQFGDVMPSRIIGPIENEKNLNKIAEWPRSWVKQNSVNIDYAFKPENSRWINFDATLWTTRTKSKTNTAGGSPGDTLYEDRDFFRRYGLKMNLWKNFMKEWPNLTDEERKELIKMGYSPDKKPTVDPITPNTDGRFNTIQGQAYYAKNERDGFTFANRMKLHPKLDLTVTGDYQYEKLRSRDNFSEELRFAGRDKYPDEIENNDVRANYSLNGYGVPRNGRRHEANLGFNFSFRPTEWLTLTVGTRYTRFSINDDSRILKEGLTKWGHPLRMNRGQVYTFTRVATPEEYAIYKSAKEDYEKNGFQDLWDPANDSPLYWRRMEEKESIDMRNGVPYINPDRMNVSRYTEPYQNPPIFYWLKDEYGRLNLADHPLLNSNILSEKVANPAYDPNNPDSLKTVYKYIRTNRTYDAEKGAVDEGVYKTDMTAAERRRAQRQSHGGWAPAFSATVNFTDRARAYLRYTETLRYPSIFEGTYGFSNAAGGFGRAGYGWKPEHAKNWEVGYIHDLTGLLPKMRRADFRINYFRNKTKNIIDRDENLEFEQFDKQVRTGVELSARFDSGRFFGGLGVLRNIKNEMCDSAFAYQDNDLVHWKADGSAMIHPPTCNHGGLSDSGYLASALQPLWSIDADLGARFFGEKLETGLRFHYHSRIKKSRDEAWSTYRKGWEEIYGKPLRVNITGQEWQPAATWDLYLRYKIRKNITAELVGTNLTDRYYLDPLSPSYMPAPGRTIRFGLTAKF